MTRRWSSGREFVLDGLRFRVVRGAKSPEDLRLDYYLAGQWRPVHMRLGALLADFFYENEEVLYPQMNGNLGGRKYLEYLRHAGRFGWEQAEAGLRVERESRLF